MVKTKTKIKTKRRDLRKRNTRRVKQRGGANRTQKNNQKGGAWWSWSWPWPFSLLFGSDENKYTTLEKDSDEADPILSYEENRQDRGSMETMPGNRQDQSHVDETEYESYSPPKSNKNETEAYKGIENSMTDVTSHIKLWGGKPSRKKRPKRKHNAYTKKK